MTQGSARLFAMERPSFPRFFVSVWHHWEASFGTTFAVMLALTQYLILAWVDPKKVPEFAKQFPPLLWLTIGLLLLFRSCYLAWKSQAMETLKVARDLEDERSIKNAPDVGLELLGGRLVIVNRSTDRDAHNIRFRTVESGGYTIEAQPIPFLGRAQKMPYSVSAMSDENGALLWDQDPEVFEPFPPNSLEKEMSLEIEYGNQHGLRYAVELRLVVSRLLGKHIKLLRVLPRHVSE